MSVRTALLGWPDKIKGHGNSKEDVRGKLITNTHMIVNICMFTVQQALF